MITKYLEMAYELLSGKSFEYAVKALAETLLALDQKTRENDDNRLLCLRALAEKDLIIAEQQAIIDYHLTQKPPRYLN